MLALTADVPVLLGAGVAAVLLVLLLVVVVRARRRRPGRTGDDRTGRPEPTQADWTGEAATGSAVPAFPAVPPIPPVASPTSAPPVLSPTVADAVAARAADPPRSLTQSPPPAADAGPPAPWARPPAEVPVVARGPVGTDRVGSSRTVAAAVSHALAVRAAAGRVGSDGAGGTETPTRGHPDPDSRAPGPRLAGTGAPAPIGAPAPSGITEPDPEPPTDARDRLLAVLLDDPARAVGAAVELEACRAQLERLSDAVRHQRSSLGEVLGRLAGAGLCPDQLARLSRLPVDEVHELLAEASSRV